LILDAAADLEYDHDGKNVIEPTPAAKDPDVVAERALGLAQGFVITESGDRVALQPESLCLHGDRPNAPDIARAVRARLEHEGIRVRSPFLDSVGSDRLGGSGDD